MDEAKKFYETCARCGKDYVVDTKPDDSHLLCYFCLPCAQEIERQERFAKAQQRRNARGSVFFTDATPIFQHAVRDAHVKPFLFVMKKDDEESKDPDSQECVVNTVIKVVPYIDIDVFPEDFQAKILEEFNKLELQDPHKGKPYVLTHRDDSESI